MFVFVFLIICRINSTETLGNETLHSVTSAAKPTTSTPPTVKPILPVQTGVKAQEEEQSSGMSIFFSLLVIGTQTHGASMYRAVFQITHTLILQLGNSHVNVQLHSWVAWLCCFSLSISWRRSASLSALNRAVSVNAVKHNWDIQSLCSNVGGQTCESRTAAG